MLNINEMHQEADMKVLKSMSPLLVQEDLLQGFYYQSSPLPISVTQYMAALRTCKVTITHKQAIVGRIMDLMGMTN